MLRIRRIDHTVQPPIERAVITAYEVRTDDNGNTVMLGPDGPAEFYSHDWELVITAAINPEPSRFYTDRQLRSRLRSVRVYLSTDVSLPVVGDAVRLFDAWGDERAAIVVEHRSDHSFEAEFPAEDDAGCPDCHGESNVGECGRCDEKRAATRGAR